MRWDKLRKDTESVLLFVFADIGVLHFTSPVLFVPLRTGGFPIIG